MNWRKETTVHRRAMVGVQEGHSKVHRRARKYRDQEAIRSEIIGQQDGYSIDHANGGSFLEVISQGSKNLEEHLAMGLGLGFNERQPFGMSSP